MNMEIRLPIELKTAVITECWTFEKLAVIQSSPLADDWLASHLSLYMDAEFSCYFGDGESYYDPAYYRDILRIEELPLFRFPKRKPCRSSGRTCVKGVMSWSCCIRE